MKKKKWSIALAVLVIGAAGIYFYLNQPARDIASEEASFVLTENQLDTDFKNNDSLANLKYADKTIEYTGTISRLIPQTHSADVDQKTVVIFKDSLLPKDIKEKQKVTFKGRFVGYDDLMQEYQIDQVTIVKK
jgi:hypothetical protein